MTLNGVVQSTITTQGGFNSAQNFQACVEPCFATLREHTLAWIDDFAIHAKGEIELLGVLERFLAICQERNLIISISKSRLYATQVKWCGRIIDGDGHSRSCQTQWLEERCTTGVRSRAVAIRTRDDVDGRRHPTLCGTGHSTQVSTGGGL